MAEHLVKFDTESEPIKVQTGILLSEAAHLAGVEISQPCGGQGRCGRCALRVTSGTVRCRSTVRLSQEDIANGYALACQSVIEGDISVSVPPQEKIERLLTSDRMVAEVSVPEGYNYQLDQDIQRYTLSMSPPDMSDQTDDWGRLQTAIRQQTGIENPQISLGLLKRISSALRQDNWQVTAIIDSHSWDCPECPPRLIDIRAGHEHPTDPLWGAAIDIGTTTITVWLVDLISGEVPRSSC